MRNIPSRLKKRLKANNQILFYPQTGPLSAPLIECQGCRDTGKSRSCDVTIIPLNSPGQWAVVKCKEFLYERVWRT